MRVLLTWGSKRGGTEGIGQMLGEALKARGFDIITAAADAVTDLERCDAVIIGGALYANRWPRSVRRFINCNLAALRKRPVWFFSSGPLDDSADRVELPAPTQVAVLAERVGAKGHVTFGGRLAPDAKGFPASAMAKNLHGDYRNPDRIRAWAAELAARLPTATPGQSIDHPARSIPRLVAHAVAGWGLCAALAAACLFLTSLTAATVVRALAAPIVFTALAWHYFRARGAREPLGIAAAWTGIMAVLDCTIVAVIVPRGLQMWHSIAGAWLPFTLIFLATWITGFFFSTLPWPKPTAEARPAPVAGIIA